MLQMLLLRFPNRGLCLPTRIKSFKINPELHLNSVSQFDSEQKGRKELTKFVSIFKRLACNLQMFLGLFEFWFNIGTI